MSRPVFRALASRLRFFFCLATLATLIQIAPNSAFAMPPSSARFCSVLFEPLFRKVPQPSKIATAHQDDVMGRASQAVIVLETRRVLPEGQYEVSIQESNGRPQAGILSVRYSIEGVSIALNSVPLIQAAEVPVQIAPDSATVTGRLSRIRLHAGNVSFINSEFSGNLTATEGVHRRDIAIEFSITAGRPSVLRLQEVHTSTVQEPGADPLMKHDYRVEMGKKI